MESKLDQFRKHLVPTTIQIDQKLIDQAKDLLSTAEFPTTRHEFWKYTRLTKISNLEQRENPAILKSLPSECVVNENAIKIVFENGKVIRELSDDFNALSGVVIKEKDGSFLSNTSDLFEALNSHYATSALTITIQAKTKIERPIHLIMISTGVNSYAMPRVSVVAEKFSESELIISTHSHASENSFTNAFINIDVQDNANLTISKIQNEDGNNYALFNERIKQDQNSTFTIHTLSLNGLWVRNNLFIDVKGQNVDTNLYGAYVLNGNQHVDNHTVIDHQKANCQSNELYKGVMDGKSTGVFNGKVFVRKDAQKINAFQSNGNVLLTDDSSINSKPELEIYADDVKCSHGSTTGQLDEDAIYYLRSRGLCEKSARDLLVTAFIGGVLEKIEDESVMQYAEQTLSKRFGWSF
jgi:Fe-S cluster assembly protein SufD